MKAMWLAAAAAIAPAVVLAVPAAFAPDAAPLVLTRTVTREMNGGERLIVRRSWEVRMHRDGAGFAVEGRLIGCTVDAPPLLAPLARLEEARPDDMFPLHLDSMGRMIAGGIGRTRTVDPAAAQTARALLGKARLGAGDAEAAERFIAALAATGGSAAWPADLFNPAQARTETRRDVALPGGGAGTVAVITEVSGRLAGGLPREVARTVTTELGGVRRTSREEWTFAPVLAHS